MLYFYNLIQCITWQDKDSCHINAHCLSNHIYQLLIPYSVEDYDKKAIDNFNVPFPMTWEEAVVNLVVFDMLRAN
jgi:hypothetical protein